MKAGRLLRARLLLVGVGAMVVVIVAGAVAQGWRSAERARLLRHQLVAERLFDGMERELTTFLSIEEARPFVEYRPDDGIIGERPAHVVGWFQIDPDGRFSVAHALDEAPRSRLQAQVDSLTGWGRSDEPAASVVTLRVPVDVPVAARPSPEPSDLDAVADAGVPDPAPLEEPVQSAVSLSVDNLSPELLPVENAFNNAFAPREGRAEQRQQVSRKQLAEFGLDEPPPAKVAAVEAPVPAEPSTPVPVAAKDPAPAPPTSRRVWVPVEVPVPDAAEPQVVDVVVSPLRVEPGEGDTLRLSRTVRLGGRTWVQGLVLDVPVLQDHLVQASLGGTGLEQAVQVRWGVDMGPEPSGVYAFGHDFYAPFQAFAATAFIQPLPAASASLDRALWGVTIALLLALAVGLLLTYRLVALTVRQARQREDFVAAITHELKSPLTSIRMYSEMLEQGVVADDAQRHGYYGTIRTEAERLSRLVDDVLLFSQMQRGLPVAEGVSGYLGEVVEDAIRRVQPQADAAGAVLQVDVAQQLRGLAVDRDALSQVLTNLLDNAVKFTVDAQDRRIHLRVWRDGERAVIEVRDHGPGVPAGATERIFEPFVRGERELTRKTKGTGIGLALARDRVRLMGGSVRASNHPDGGLLVAVTVPAA